MSQRLEDLVLAHRYLYYVRGEPFISDYDYDMLEKRARKELPETSPAWTVGSSLARDYSERIVALAQSIARGSEAPL